MYKKRTLALVIASAFALQGCLDTDKSPENANVNQTDPTAPSGAGNVWPVFNPATGALPIPNDLIFQQTVTDASGNLTSVADGTFSVDDTLPPVTTALNILSGASTTAPIDIAMSGLIDASSVDGNPFVLDASGNPTALPNANQNVFLVELAYASGSPVQGLSISEPPTVVQPTSATYTAEVSTLIDGSGNSISNLRINLLSPLKPNTRYVVAITTDILDTTGAPISASPGLTGYGALTNAQVTPVDAALNPVQDIINGLWEPTALGYINGVKSALSQPTISDNNVAMSYSFTTSGDEAVLSYIANPASWFDDQLTTFLGVSAAGAIVTGQTDVNADGNVDYSDIQLAVAGAIAGFPDADTSLALDAAGLSQAVVQSVPGCGTVTNGASYISCLSAVLGSSTGPFGALLPTPQPATVDFTTNTAPTSDLFSVLAGVDPAISAGYAAAGFTGFTAPGSYQVAQGTMSIPYYSGLPTDIGSGTELTNAALGTGLPLKYSSWTANSDLANAINTAFASLGLTIPQGIDTDPDTAGIQPASSVVNYIFPFPAQQDGDVVTAGTQNITVPIIAVYPTGATTPMKTAIWGHGLNGNRTNGLPFAAGLTGYAKTLGTDLAVLMFDEPLHGVVGDATAFHTDNERHFEYGNAGVGPENPPLDIDLTSLAGQGSGSMFVNLESFATSRDNLRQNVLDLFALRKAIGSIDVDPGANLGADLDGSNVYYIGHSLGTISAQAFVAVANDPASADPLNDTSIDAAAFYTPGGGMTRFFENSPTFAPDIIDALAGSLLTPATTGYQTYLNTLQATLDAVDAVNFVGDYAGQGTNVLYVNTVNDGVIPISQNSEDRTLQTTTTNGNAVSGSVSYLSGAEPLAEIAGATALETAGTTNLGISLVRYQETQADHCSPSVPGSAMFSENLVQTASILLSDPNSPTITVSAGGATLIETSDPLPLPPTTAGCPLSFPPTT